MPRWRRYAPNKCERSRDSRYRIYLPGKTASPSPRATAARTPARGSSDHGIASHGNCRGAEPIGIGARGARQLTGRIEAQAGADLFRALKFEISLDRGSWFLE